MDSLKRRFYDKNDNLFLHHSPKILFNKLGKKFKEKDIKKCLRSQPDYTLYKQPSTEKNKRNVYKVFTIDQL